MKIGIDARLYGPEHTGLGRYVTNLVDNLLKIDKKNQYVLFVTQKHLHNFTPNLNLKLVKTDIPIYSFSEQLILPFVFLKEKLDLLHVPHFNAPILYRGRTILTVHDLIKHSSRGPETTTRSPWFYWLKRLAYHFQVFVVARKASSILVPSNYAKQDISQKLNLSGKKITVTYESSASNIKKITLDKLESAKTLAKYNLTQPFLVYTGNLYPHKNIDLLIEAVTEHNKNKEVDLCLAIVCARSAFFERANKKIINLNAQDRIKLLGFLEDEELSKLYSLALALVHPSKMEGFGLTGLEAMRVGLPVISSNFTSLPEVYGDACLYFDPDSVADLVFKIEEVIKKPEVRASLASKGLAQAKKYSWKKMALKTLSAYKDVSDK